VPTSHQQSHPAAIHTTLSGRRHATVGLGQLTLRAAGDGPKSGLCQHRKLTVPEGYPIIQGPLPFREILELGWQGKDAGIIRLSAPTSLEYSMLWLVSDD